MAIFLSPCTNRGVGLEQDLSNRRYPGVPCYRQQRMFQLKSPRAMSPLPIANMSTIVLLSFREIRGEPGPQGPEVFTAWLWYGP